MRIIDLQSIYISPCLSHIQKRTRQSSAVKSTGGVSEKQAAARERRNAMRSRLKEMMKAQAAAKRTGETESAESVVETGDSGSIEVSLCTRSVCVWVGVCTYSIVPSTFRLHSHILLCVCGIRVCVCVCVCLDDSQTCMCIAFVCVCVSIFISCLVLQPTTTAAGGESATPPTPPGEGVSGGGGGSRVKSSKRRKSTGKRRSRRFGRRSSVALINFTTAKVRHTHTH